MIDIYRALGDPTRRRILQLLATENKTQKEIVDAFDISQPAIKKHLHILLEGKLIYTHKQGKFRVYSLDRERLQAAYDDMFKYIGDLLDNQLKDLKNYVEKGDVK